MCESDDLLSLEDEDEEEEEDSICGNCGKYLEPEGQYCTCCGTPRGQALFEPEENEMECVYGPPIRTKYRCPNCGHVWIAHFLGRDLTKYCPRCGQAHLEALSDTVFGFDEDDI